jgi:phosphoribosylformylglycinamidine synthase
VYRHALMSWTNGDIGKVSPWMRMFRNARVWIG